MKIIKININQPNPDAIKSAANTLFKGGLVVYPTDTAYGIGANAYNVSAVRKIYEVKGREFSKPTHVIISGWKMLEEISYTNSFARKLFSKFLPGPLTLILKRKDIVPDVLVAGLPTIGIRLPDCTTTKLISETVDFPYTTPSANISGGNTPYSINEVRKELDLEKIDLVLDAGKLSPIPPSTIIKLTGETPQLVREGPVKKHEIDELLGLTTL